MMISDQNTSIVFAKGPPDINIVVVGDSYVGKTALLKTFVTREYPKSYDGPSLERYFEDITVAGQDFHIVVWEPIVLENSGKMREFIYGKADCVIVCYAVNNLESFGHIASFWFPEIHKNCRDTPVMLAGTEQEYIAQAVFVWFVVLFKYYEIFFTALKTDLRNRQLNCIPRSKGKELKVNLNASGYIECSSLLDIGVKEVFVKAIQCVLRGGDCKVT